MNKFFFVAFFVLTSAYSQYNNTQPAPVQTPQYSPRVTADYLYDYAARRKASERAKQAEEDRMNLKREKARYYREEADKLARERKAAEKKSNYINSSITSYTKSRGFLYSKTDIWSESFILPKYTPVKKMSDLINNLWYRVRVEDGENKGKTGYLHKTSFEE